MLVYLPGKVAFMVAFKLGRTKFTNLSNLLGVAPDQILYRDSPHSWHSKAHDVLQAVWMQRKA